MKELPSRSTRGKRLNDLLDEEKDFDGYFWSQELFKDTVSDDEYRSESEKVDKFDEDFFKEESESDKDEVTAEPDTQKKQKISKKLKKVQKKSLKFKKIEGITQKEMLEQAAIVEMYNAHDLCKLMRNEENSKVSLVSRKEKGIPCWRYKEVVKQGKRKSTIWHSEGLESFGRKKPVRNYCAVTGGLARYRDPLTGKYYADKEAFKVIRAQYFSEQEEIVQGYIKDLENQVNSYT